MYALGLMSGTSLDGVDVCLVEIKEDKNNPCFKEIGFQCYPYSSNLKEKILEASKLDTSNVQKICSLNVELSYSYVNAISEFLKTTSISIKEISYIAMHGQTVWHNPNQRDGYFSSTLQLGDPAILAYAFNKMVISNFRMMDMAAGGSGAPLIPFVDYYLFANAKRNIALQNIGGIGNVCFISQSGKKEDTIAFDTGVGNMLIDEATQYFYNEDYDSSGNHAKNGVIHEDVLALLMKDTYLDEPLPKSTGRERYSKAFFEWVLSLFPKDEIKADDVIATLSAFTADSISYEYQKFLPKLDQVIVSGGGSHNSFIMARLQSNLKVDVVESKSTDSFEAFGFAILGYCTLNKKPSNLCQVTGAKDSVILGNITFAPRKED